MLISVQAEDIKGSKSKRLRKLGPCTVRSFIRFAVTLLNRNHPTETQGGSLARELMALKSKSMIASAVVMIAVLSSVRPACVRAHKRFGSTLSIT
jgi:hypothetical protein